MTDNAKLVAYISEYFKVGRFYCFVTKNSVEDQFLDLISTMGQINKGILTRVDILGPQGLYNFLMETITVLRNARVNDIGAENIYKKVAGIIVKTARKNSSGGSNTSEQNNDNTSPASSNALVSFHNDVQNTSTPTPINCFYKVILTTTEIVEYISKSLLLSLKRKEQVVNFVNNVGNVIY
jgi:hypothetical protein